MQTNYFSKVIELRIIAISIIFIIFVNYAMNILNLCNFS